MVLIQLAIQNSTYTVYNVNLRGTFKAKIKHFSYMYSGAAGTHEILCMKSNQWNFTNSSVNGYIFTNQSGHVQYNGEGPEFTIYNLNQVLDLIITKLDGTAPTNFAGAVLTLEMEPIIDPLSDEVKYRMM